MTHRNYGFRAPTQSDDQDGSAMVVFYAFCSLCLAIIVAIAVVI